MLQTTPQSDAQRQPGRTRPLPRAILVGGAIWLVLAAACMYLRDHRVTTVLMPLWVPVASLAGTGPNMGTPDRPAYEATPVHAVFGIAGILFSAPVYIALVYGGLRWRQRRSLGQHRSGS